MTDHNHKPLSDLLLTKLIKIFGGKRTSISDNRITIGTFFYPHYTPDQEQLNEFSDFNIHYLTAICNVIKGQYPNVTGNELDTLLVSVRADAMKLIGRLGE